jgi:broad specificity phosphatase PhoE
MPEVILVRHTATGWTGIRYAGASDVPLSETGRAAAGLLASDLAPTLAHGTRIVSSPLIRARDTAAAIATAAGITGVEIDERWREVDFGRLEGRTFDEVASTDPALAARLLSAEHEIDWPGGDTASAFRHRVASAWHDALARAPIIVVTHAGPIRIAAALAQPSGTTAPMLTPPGAVVRVAV